MKKITYLLIAIMTFTFVLAGCSTEDVVQDDINTEENTETKIISTTMGDVEIPVDPERVVIDYFVGDALALGVEPVGTTYIYEGAYFEDELEGIPSINGDNSYGEYSMEKVLQLEPDLIITAFQTDYDKLSKIAPTVFVDYTNMTAEERLNLIGEALGKKDKVPTILEDFNELAESSKSKLKDAGVLDKTISLFETSQKSVYVYGDKQGRGGEVLYDILDMQAPKIIEDEIIGGEQWRSLSFEVLDQYIGDYVMIGGWEENPMDTVGDNPVWNSTYAVKNENVIEYNSKAYIYQDIFTTKAQLNEIVEALIEKSNQ